MKTVYVGFFIFQFIIVGSYLANLHVRLGTPYSDKSRTVYPIICEPNEPNLTYSIVGLPEDAFLSENEIFFNHIKEGSYIFKIKVSRDNQYLLQQIIALRINHEDIQQKIYQQSKSKPKQSQINDAASFRLGSILSQHSTTHQKQNHKYTQNKYPQHKFQLNQDSDIFSSQPVNILTNNETDQKSALPGSHDVLIQTATKRYENAVKSINELLKMVEQAKRKRLQAKDNVETYSNQLNTALAEQRKINEDKFSTESKVIQIDSAIQGLEQLIQHLQKELDSADAKKLEMQEIKNNLLKTIEKEEQLQASLVTKVKVANEKLAQKMNQLTKKLIYCSNISSQKENTKEKINQLKIKLGSVITKRRKAEIKASHKRQKVDDLKKQLRNAEKQLIDAEIELSDIKDEETRIPNAIASIDKRIQHLEKKDQSCSTETKELQNLISKLKNDDVIQFNNKIHQIKERNLQYNKLSEINQNQVEVEAKIEDLRSKLNKSVPDLEFLREQIVETNKELQALFFLQNQASLNVDYARQNLHMAVNKYKNSQTIASEGTLNLEKARIQESLAKSALDKLKIKHGNNANEKESTGKVYSHRQNQRKNEQKKYIINNWNEYLSHAFGDGVYTSFRGTVKELYPFNYFQGRNQRKVEHKYGSMRHGCGGTGPIKSITGKIINIREDSFDVRESNGNIFKIKVDLCTKMSTNSYNPKVIRGIEAIVKGKMKASYLIAGTQTIFLYNNNKRL